MEMIVYVGAREPYLEEASMCASIFHAARNITCASVQIRTSLLGCITTILFISLSDTVARSQEKFPSRPVIQNQPATPI